MKRTLLALALFGTLILPGCSAVHAAQQNIRPTCKSIRPLVLMAQAVPTAAEIPCVGSLPAGWHFHGFDARSGQATFWLDSDVAGKSALAVALRPSCATRGARRIASDERGTALFRRVASSQSLVETSWLYRSEGACAVYRLRLPVTLSHRQADRLVEDVRRGLSFVSRGTVAASYRRQGGSLLDPATSP
jgi:hypothetical protein